MEEHRLKLFQNRMTRNWFRLKRDRETGEWRRLYEEETEYWYSSTGAVWAVKSRRVWWPENMGGKESSLQSLCGENWGKETISKTWV